jgi:site-specific recombinase XerD
MATNENDLLKSYLQELAASGYEKVLKWVSYRLTRLFEYLEENELKLEDVGVKEAQEYQGWLLETGRKDLKSYAKGSIHNFLKEAVRFYRFLKKKGVVYTNPFAEVKRVRVELKLPRNILKEKEMNLLLEKLSRFEGQKGLKSKVRRYKVHVICELQYSTALRIGEVASLKEEDIDWERGVVELREGKGGKSRSVFLNEYAKQLLWLYVKQMRGLVMCENNRRDLLFGAGAGRLMTIVNEELARAASLLKLGRFTSHGFRHAVGFHLLKAGCDIRFIQEILGHERLHNTEIYTRVEKKDLKAVLDRYHPRQFKSINCEKA